MKNKYFSLIIAFLAFACLSSLCSGETGKKKILIHTFEAPESSAYLGSLLTQKLITALKQNSSLDVVKDTSEGADYIIMSNIEGIEPQKLIINLRMLDAKTRKPIYAKKLTVGDRDAVSDNLNDMAICEIATIISETVDPIKIESIQGAYAFLNRGESSSLRPGMRLNVYVPNTSTIDPTTGEVLRDSEYAIAELKVTEVLPKLTKAQILHYSASIEVGALSRTLSECK